MRSSTRIASLILAPLVAPSLGAQQAPPPDNPLKGQGYDMISIDVPVSF